MPIRIGISCSKILHAQKSYSNALSIHKNRCRVNNVITENGGSNPQGNSTTIPEYTWTHQLQTRASSLTISQCLKSSLSSLVKVLFFLLFLFAGRQDDNCGEIPLWIEVLQVCKRYVRVQTHVKGMFPLCRNNLKHSLHYIGGPYREIIGNYVEVPNGHLIKPMFFLD